MALVTASSAPTRFPAALPSGSALGRLWSVCPQDQSKAVLRGGVNEGEVASRDAEQDWPESDKEAGQEGAGVCLDQHAATKPSQARSKQVKAGQQQNDIKNTRKQTRHLNRHPSQAEERASVRAHNHSHTKAILGACMRACARARKESLCLWSRPSPSCPCLLCLPCRPSSRPANSAFGHHAHPWIPIPDGRSKRRRSMAAAHCHDFDAAPSTSPWQRGQTAEKGLTKTSVTTMAAAGPWLRAGGRVNRRPLSMSESWSARSKGETTTPAELVLGRDAVVHVFWA